MNGFYRKKSRARISPRRICPICGFAPLAAAIGFVLVLAVFGVSWLLPVAITAALVLLILICR